ncbi:MAG TPA: septum formation initiator family protein [Pseudolabrys sp.]|nr:septum formation initiator family protein [Pseudolabrys sp.]
MVSHRRRRAILTAIALYSLAAMFIGYFGVHAFTGNHGLRAQQQVEVEIARLEGELLRLKRDRASWEHRVSLLQSERLDPDMLDERARALLDYADPRDATLLLKTQ